MNASMGDMLGPISDNISQRSVAKSEQYNPKGGLRNGTFYNDRPEFNSTSNSINGRPGGTRFKPRVDQYMQPIMETAADIQDEYEASKLKASQNK